MILRLELEIQLSSLHWFYLLLCNVFEITHFLFSALFLCFSPLLRHWADVVRAVLPPTLGGKRVASQVGVSSVQVGSGVDVDNAA